MLRKTVIITGASGGIGLATAKKFASAGYNLALTYNKNKIDSKTFSDFDVDVKTYKLDISNSKQVAKVFENIFNDFEYVDCLIANAGIAEPETLLIEKSDDEIKNILDTNLFGTIITNRECMKYFIKNKHGNIINISSIQGQIGHSCSSIYSASKSGIITLTQSLAKEIGCFGIRVNAIAPGFIQTQMTSCFDKNEINACKKHIPLNRIGQPEEIASTALFLASDDASYITGQVIGVNGGAVLFE